jgi:hypothetical protein
MSEKGLSKIIIQVIFIILLIVMFAIDKVLHMVEPPLQDIWYMIVLALAV